MFLDDKVPLSLFRAVKATLALTQDAEKALYEAGEFFAKKCLVKANIKDVQLIIQEIQKGFTFKDRLLRKRQFQREIL